MDSDHNHRQRTTTHKQRSGLWLAGLFIILAALACTSNDTLFIKLTAVPTATITPTPLSSQTETRFKVGQDVYVIGTSRQISLGDRPGVKNLTTLGNFASCFRNSKVTITEASRSAVDTADPVFYYNIDCKSSTGWVPEYSLTPFNPSGGKAVIKSPDGKGAPLYKQADTSSPLVQDAPCADGTTVTLSDVTRKLNVAAQDADLTQFAKVKCGDVTGFVLETSLAPVAP